MLPTAPEGAGAGPGLGHAFWPGQPSWQGGMTWELQSSSSVPAAAPRASPSSGLVVSTASSSA